jgi:hypothetical protein
MDENIVHTEETAKTLEQLARQVTILTDLVNVLNNAVVAISYGAGIRGDELDKLTADDYVKYVHEHVHPLTRRATEIVTEIAMKTKEEIEKKAAEEAKKETKKTKKGKK